MSDQRELILARLVEIAATAPGVVTVVRNVINWNDIRLPGVAVLEGDEEADEDDKIMRTTLIPRRVRMVPQLVIAIGDDPEALGTRLNELRAEMITRVLSDEALLAMTINSLGIRYVSMQSDLALGRQMFGQMVLNFRIDYWLDPSNL